MPPRLGPALLGAALGMLLAGELATRAQQATAGGPGLPVTPNPSECVVAPSKDGAVVRNVRPATER